MTTSLSFPALHFGVVPTNASSHKLVKSKDKNYNIHNEIFSRYIFILLLLFRSAVSVWWFIVLILVSRNPR